MGDSHSSSLVPHPCCGLTRRRVVEKTPMCVKTPRGIQTEPPLMCLHFQYHTGPLVHSINVLLFLSLRARINLYRLVFQEECACWYRFLQENSSPLIGVSFIWTLMGGAVPISPCMMISWGVAALIKIQKVYLVKVQAEFWEVKLFLLTLITVFPFWYRDNET